MQRYGVPLDSRTQLTKTDWSFWSATLAEKQADFEAIVSPIYDYLNATTARDPLADSYETDNVAQRRHARPAGGGRVLHQDAHRPRAVEEVGRRATSRRSATGRRCPSRRRSWRLSHVAASSRSHWRYTTGSRPKSGPSPASTRRAGRKGRAGSARPARRASWSARPGTTDDIWLRREFTMPDGNVCNLQFFVFHDEDVEIYVNGVLAAKANGFITSYEPMEIRRAPSALKPGAEITLAVHCHQTEGGQGVSRGAGKRDRTATVSL